MTTKERFYLENWSIDFESDRQDVIDILQAYERKGRETKEVVKSLTGKEITIDDADRYFIDWIIYPEHDGVRRIWMMTDYSYFYR